MRNLYEIIQSCKDGNEEDVIFILNKFDPLINKYSRLLEYEDTKQELSLTLIKLLQRIRIDKGNFREDKYIISYIKKSIINRGVKTTNLYVTRYTSMPCVLVECSFVDSNQDMDKYNGNDIAEAIVKAITNSEHDSKPDLSLGLEESKELRFSYSNNAKVIGDFLYVRDSMGNIIPGRRVDIGDNITVLDVSYAKQLVLAHYPTASGVKRGYVTNATNCIEYYYQDEYSNGSTKETVYDENDLYLGSIDPFEKATPLYRKDSRLHVVYTTNKGKNTKSGYVIYNGNFNKF